VALPEPRMTPSSPTRRISVLASIAMGSRTLGERLDALAQELATEGGRDFDWELSMLVRDGENERVASRARPFPVQLTRIAADDCLDPWDRNRLVGTSSGEWALFLPDETAEGPAKSLAPILATLHEGRAQAIFRRSSTRAGGLELAAIERKLWERHPLPLDSTDSDSELEAALRGHGIELAMISGASANGSRAQPRSVPLAPGPLRVLQVIHSFPPDTMAGSELYTLQLSQALRRRGHHVAVIARRAPEDLPEDSQGREFSVERDEYEGIDVWRVVNRVQPDRLERSYDEPRALAPLREVLLAERPDVVHIQHLLHHSIGIIDLCRELAIPTVLHGHDYFAICPRVQLVRPDGTLCEGARGAECFLCVHERALSQIDRLGRQELEAPECVDRLERDVDHWFGLASMRKRPERFARALGDVGLFLCPSRFLRDRHLGSLELARERVVFSPYGQRKPTQLPDARTRSAGDPVRFAFVGTLSAHKGVRVAIEAFGQLDDPHATLDIHGAFEPREDSYHARLEELAHGTARLRFHGRFDGSRVAEIYRDVDVLIVPSVWYENSPLVLMEAAQFGIPCLVSDLGGMAEWISDGQDGLHFRVGDAADLCHKMRRFLDEPGLLEELAPRADRVKDMEVSAAELEFVYRSLACRAAATHPVGTTRVPACATHSEDGAVRLEDDDLLLGPSPELGVAEFELGPLSAGDYRLRLSLPTRANEAEMIFGGRIWLGAERMERILPFGGLTQGCVREVSFSLTLPECDGEGSSAWRGLRLRLDNGGEQSGATYALRLRELELTALSPAMAMHRREWRGVDSLNSGATVQSQAPDMALLGPAPDFVEYDISEAPRGEVELGIWFRELLGETRTPFGGRVLIDGRMIGRLPLILGCGEERSFVYPLRMHLAAPDRVLRIENRGRRKLNPFRGKRPLFARIQLIRIERVKAP